MNILLIIIVFQFLIFIHELGHFLVAKYCKVKVEEFSLGIPPKILSKKFKDTVYILSLLPIGGYVKMKGFMIDEDSQDPSNYCSKTIGQRFSIIFAGPLFNIITCFFLLTLVYWIGFQRSILSYVPAVIGNPAGETILQKGDEILKVNDKEISKWRDFISEARQVPGDSSLFIEVLRQGKIIPLELPVKNISNVIPRIEPIIGAVIKNSPAERIGLKAQDRILSINNKPVEDWGDISFLLEQNAGNKGFLLIEREGRRLELEFFAEQKENPERWVLGISVPQITESYPLTEAMFQGAKTMADNVITTFSFLARLIVGKSSSDALGGPIMIVSIMNQSIDRGLVSLLFIAAIISLQLALFNLLPIPALDGGHLFLLLLEKIKGSPISIGFRNKFQFIGFFLLIALFIYITIKDISRLF